VGVKVVLLKQKERGGVELGKKNNINIYRLRKYEEYKDLPYEDLEIIYEQVQEGIIDLKGKEFRKDSGKKKTIKTYTYEDPENNVETVDDVGVRRFILEVLNNITLRLLIEKNRKSISFVRKLYSNTNLTVKEVSFILEEDPASMTYYLRKFGIKKLPKDVQVKIMSVKGLERFLDKPEPEMVEVPTNESDQEFRERYKRLSFKIFARIKELALNGDEDSEELKKLNTAVATLNNTMKLERESKKILVYSKEKEFEMKEKEIESKSGQQSVILEVGDNIELQQKILDLKLELDEMDIDESLKDKILQKLLK